MPIGVFALRSGLTSSALRFYADSGLLPPAEVDQASGYRYYSAEQVATAAVLRQLREIAMPLRAVEEVLAAGSEEASRLVDEYVAGVVAHAADAQRRAAVIKASLGGEPSSPVVGVVGLKGPVLADAVEQVLTATAHEPGMPVLGGVLIETGPDAVTLTATNRYRLATRTLVPTEPPAITWSAAIDGDDLRSATVELRRSAVVTIDSTPHGMWLRPAGGDDRHCRQLAERFPDHRRMLAALPAVSTRVVVALRPLLRALEEHPGERIALHVSGGDASVRPTGGGAEIPLPATTTGDDLEIWFDLTTLYPAVSTAVGPDVLLDLRGPERPVTIRSADRGDLTTLAMPTRPGHCT